MKNILRTIWRRLCSVKHVGPHLVNLKDLWSWYSVRGHPLFQKGVDVCGPSSVEDWFNLAQLTFGSQQKRGEICRFLEFMRLRSPQLVCEIGVAAGGTHFLLRESIPSVKKIIGVEIALRTTVARKLQRSCNKGKEDILIQGSSCTHQTLTLVETNLQGQKLDLLFIDGDHGYDGVRADFEAYRHFLREGAIVAFHDIMPDYATRKGIKTDNWAGGVPIFWREVKNGFLSWELVENSEQDAFGIGLLEYRSENRNKIVDDNKLDLLT